MQSTGAIMSSAHNALKGRWGKAILVYVIMIAIYLAISFLPILNYFSYLIIDAPLSLGLAIFFLGYARGEDREINDLFKGYNDFGRLLVVSLLSVLIITFGFFLLIIPGFILSLGLSMTYFILAENPTLRPVDVLRQSWEMMKGHKADLFVMSLALFGLSILCLFTLGIGFLWLAPYSQACFVKFYEEIKEVDTEGYTAESDVLDSDFV